MAVLQGRTREQIRVSIGRLLKGSNNGRAVRVSTMTANGSATTLVDGTLRGSDNEHNGKWIAFTSSPNDGEIRQVLDYDEGTQTITIDATDTALSSTVSGNTYELWDEMYPPDDANDAINDAITDVTGRAFDPVENRDLFFDNVTTRFDFPTGITMIRKLQYRTVDYITLDEADDAWTAGTSVTVTADTELKKRGTGSNKIVMAAGVAAGDVIAHKTITSEDITDYTHVEFWARCSTTTAAAAFKFLIDDTTAAVSPIETLSFPALTADTWTYVRLALANADDLTAVISLGIEDDTDVGAETLWIDDVRVTKEHTERWTSISPHLWGIEKESRDLVLSDLGRQVANYAAMKMIGGDTPVLLTADATTSEIHASFIRYRAAGMLAIAAGVEDSVSGGFFALSNQQKRRFDILQDARIIT
tara:strand:+ start:5205 stop:6458 length:1254 start_codon:yes stop_codon:yes gene_type:complete